MLYPDIIAFITCVMEANEVASRTTEKMMPTTSLQLANIKKPQSPSLEAHNSVKGHLLDKKADEYLEEMLKDQILFLQTMNCYEDRNPFLIFQ